MSDNLDGSQLLVRQLRAKGVYTSFTVIAAPMQFTLRACDEAGIRVVGCRHEEQAAFTTRVYGYVCGQAGVVVVGSGPGTVNAVPGMLVARENGWPLVVIGGSVASRER